MKQVLLDTDVILDLYLDREPFAEAEAALWAAHEAGHLTASDYLSQFPLPA